jgi:hypothetical protein
MKKIVMAFIGLGLAGSSAIAGYTDTGDYWKCTNKSGGSWNFGRAPNSCDVYHFVDPEYIRNEFTPVIFNDSANIDDERREYMNYMYGVIRDTAAYYIKSRKPDVSEEELEAFVAASYAIAHQESYWSHYRVPSNGRLQFMRGDYGHGHGMMQVDDRWHFAAVNEGKGANLIFNLIYALEEYYDAWKVAPSKSCVSSPTNWYDRTRSAYSAYNGGISRICRWTNPNDKWSRNDKGFKAKFDNKQWESYVDDFDQPSFVDVECIASGGSNCENDGSGDATPRKSLIYRSAEYGACVFEEETEVFKCTQERFAQCLHHKVYAKSSGRVGFGKIRDEWDVYNFEEVETEGICSSVAGLMAPGTKIALGKNINVRRTPGGEKLGVMSKGKVTQVLSYEVTDAVELKRYYQVSFGSKRGYVYAGNKSDYAAWAKVSTSSLNYQSIASTGDHVIAHEAHPSLEDRDLTLEKGMSYEVLSVNYKDDLSLEYELSVDGTSYSFYAGSLNPYTHDELFKIGKAVVEPTPEPTPKPQVKYGRLSKSIWWKKMYKCPSTSCGKAGTLRGPRLTSSKLKIYENKNGWLKVEQKGKVGWIQQWYVKIY